MNRILFSELGPYDSSLPTIDDPNYFSVDVVSLKSAQNPSTIEQIRVRHNGHPFNVWAIIGKNAASLQMIFENDYAILPCPPYCGKGGGIAYNVLQDDSSDTTKISFAEALTMFP
jgi:hypothetical protein